MVNYYKSLLQFTLVFIFLILSTAAVANHFCFIGEPVPGQSRILGWIVDNWFQIALIISEIAALLPGKYTGILKSLLNLIGEVLKKRAGRTGKK